MTNNVRILWHRPLRYSSFPYYKYHFLNKVVRPVVVFIIVISFIFKAIVKLKIAINVKQRYTQLLVILFH